MKWLVAFIFVQNLLIQTQALVTKQGKTPQESYLVTNLPGLYENIPKDEIPTIFSGTIELYKENRTYYYFQKYVDQHKVESSKKKSFFWLNGGPGCSSMDGALMEAGPFRINKDGQVTYNNGSWHKAGDIIFVDQPAGTGFSYSEEHDHTLYDVANHFLKFLEKYFEVFPQEKNNEIYLSGESYAGQYIPFIASRILEYNSQTRAKNDTINLKGLLIGNGWIDPIEQSLSYLPYSMQAGILDKDSPGLSDVLKQHEACQQTISHIKSGNIEGFRIKGELDRNCEKILNMILSITRDQSGPSDQECINMYDYTLRDSYPSCGMNWPPDLEYVKPFLNDDSNLKSLNIHVSKHWRECSGSVGRHLTNDNVPFAISLFPDLLKQVPILLFHGNRDIICNYIGAEKMIEKLAWGGSTGFSEDSPIMDWEYKNRTVGYVRSERNLTFVNVFDASHMVPFDDSEVSRGVIDLLLKEFDERTEDDKHIIETYPLGVWQSKANEPTRPAIGTETEDSATPNASASAGSDTDANSNENSDSDNEAQKESSTSKITRIIQLTVIFILLWGVYVLYKSYKARPSSIIKSGPSSGKKKNVQWADQLSNFEDDNDTNLSPPKEGFLSKAYSKFTGNDGKGNYHPTMGEDIELGDTTSGPSPSQFEIESDDETQGNPVVGKNTDS